MIIDPCGYANVHIIASANVCRHYPACDDTVRQRFAKAAIHRGRSSRQHSSAGHARIGRFTTRQVNQLAVWETMSHVVLMDFSRWADTDRTEHRKISPERCGVGDVFGDIFGFIFGDYFAFFGDFFGFCLWQRFWRRWTRLEALAIFVLSLCCACAHGASWMITILDFETSRIFFAHFSCDTCCRWTHWSNCELGTNTQVRYKVCAKVDVRECEVQVQTCPKFCEFESLGRFGFPFVRFFRLRIGQFCELETLLWFWFYTRQDCGMTDVEYNHITHGFIFWDSWIFSASVPCSAIQYIRFSSSLPATINFYC